MPGNKRSRVQENDPSTSSSTVGKDQEVPNTPGFSGNCIDNVLSHQNENPLMNHLVLRTLFEYVKPDNLPTCRLVCKMWNTIALPFVRAKCEVTIQALDYSKPGNQRKNTKRTKNRTIGAFVKSMRSNTTGIPFSKFKWEEYRGTAMVKRMFLRICGYTIKVMNLSTCNMSLAHLSEILSSVPNLELFNTPWHLGLGVNREDMDIKLFSDNITEKPRLPRLKALGIVDGLNVKKKVFRILFKELLEIGENISSIIFIDYIRLEQYDVVLEVLNVIESIGRESSIQNLSVPRLTEANSEILKRMIRKNKGMKLKKLMIQYDGPEDVWFQLASLCKDDLVELSSNQKASRHAFYNLADSELPVMTKLKLLEVTPPPGRSSFLYCNFNNTFPVLEKLSIRNRFMAVNVDELFTGQEPCPSMKLLHLKEIPLKIDTLARIIFMFPALTKIQVKVKVGGGLKNFLRLLWTTMTQLEDLDLHIGEAFNIDPLFTGIKFQECRHIKLNNSYLCRLESMSDEEWTDEILELGAVRKNPSIANLTSNNSIISSFSWFDKTGLF